MKSSENSHFQNCPDEPEIPWFQVLRPFIRNPKLSLEAKGLMTYFMSHRDNFNISIPFVIKTQKVSKNKIYRIIDECIEEGYLKRETYLDQGKKRYRYMISKTGRFKKSLLCPQNQDTEKQDPENEDSKVEQSLISKDIIDKREQLKGADAREILPKFEEYIKKILPDCKKPTAEYWESEIEKMIRIDKRDPQDIKKIIEWLPSSNFWRKNILCPKKLREKFDRLMLEMIDDASNSSSDGLNLIQRLGEILPVLNTLGVDLSSSYVDFKRPGECFNVSDKTFVQNVLHSLRKRNAGPKFLKFLETGEKYET